MGALQHVQRLLHPVETRRQRLHAVRKEGQLPVQLQELAGQDRQDPVSQRLAQRRILIECPNDVVNGSWTRHAATDPSIGRGDRSRPAVRCPMVTAFASAGCMAAAQSPPGGRSCAELRRPHRPALVIEFMPPWKPEPGFGGPFIGLRRLPNADVKALVAADVVALPAGEVRARLPRLRGGPRPRLQGLT